MSHDDTTENRQLLKYHIINPLCPCPLGTGRGEGRESGRASGSSGFLGRARDPAQVHWGHVRSTGPLSSPPV